MKSNLLRVTVFTLLLMLSRACPADDQTPTAPQGETPTAPQGEIPTIPQGEIPAVPLGEKGLQQQEDYAPYPEPDHGYVTDLGDVLSQADEEQLEKWLWITEAKTGVEIAVVTIRTMKDYPGTANDSIESFARGLFDRYGIGNLPKNNGVLLLVSRDDRKARIELGKGYGQTRNGDATRIMQGEIVPKFKAGEYSQGIVNGTKGIMLEFARVRVGFNWQILILIGVILGLVLLTISLFRSGKRGWAWFTLGILITILGFLARAIYVAMKEMPKGSSDSWSSGGHGGGFGGGSSGGGGATGSW